MGRNPYVGDARSREARKKGYPARSVFKLEEIDRRVKVLRPGQAVLDLGCAPGSWSLYAAQRVGRRGLVLGLDLQACEVAAPAQLTLVQADAWDVDEAQLRDLTEGRCPPFDAVISDMAPRTTGIKSADHAASMDLCERALEVTRAVLAPGGSFVVKAFEGADLKAFENAVREQFDRVKRIKPRGTRSRSVEVFLVAQGRRPA